MVLPARISGRAAVTATTAAAVALTLASGAGTPAAATTATAPRATATTVLRATTSDGSRILVEVPARWNGTLALYSHGYRSPTDPDHTAQDASTRDTAAALLTQGYALAGSSYPRNGWAVAGGVRADELLLSWVHQHVHGIQRVYVWGDSLGGLVTETFAERHPAAIAAAAPMCGVLAGANRNLDEALDAAVAVRQLLVPGLKLRGFRSYTQAQAADDSAMKTITDGLASADPTTQARFASRVLAVGAIADAPRKSQHYDGVGLAHSVGAEVEAIGYAVFYGTVGRYDIERRMGGDPSTNVGVDYTKRISAADVAWYQSFGFSEGLLRSYAKTVQAFGARLRPVSAARAKFQRVGGNPTGRLGKPTVTLHTEDDPLVLVQNERVFARRVAAAGESGRLLQLYVKPPASYSTTTGAPFGAGHCAFTTGDRVAVVKTLDAWLAHHAKPTAAQVSALFPAGEGLDLGYRPPAWPVR